MIKSIKKIIILFAALVGVVFSGTTGKISGKIVNLENLNYWNVELQEPYFSYKEAALKRENK